MSRKKRKEREAEFENNNKPRGVLISPAVLETSNIDALKAKRPSHFVQSCSFVHFILRFSQNVSVHTLISRKIERG